MNRASFFPQSLPRNARALVAFRAACFGVLLLLTGRVSAATTQANWISATSGNWSDAARWSTNPVYPNGVNYDATIAATGSSYSVGVDGSFVINSLTLDSPDCTFNSTPSGSLQASSIDVRRGTFILRNLIGARMTVDPAATLNFNNNPVLRNITFASDVTVTTLAHVTLFNLGLEGGSALHMDATSAGTSIFLRFYEPSQITGSGEIVYDGIASGYSYLGHGLTEDASLTIGAGITVRTGTGNGILGNPGPDRPITNHGTVRSQTAGRILDIQASTFTNHGAVSATAGSMQIRCTNFTNLGQLSVAAGATLSANTLGSWSNSASVSSAGGTLNLLGSSWSNAGTILAAGGALNLSGSWSNTGSISANAGATVTLGGTSTNVGSLTVTDSNVNVAGAYTTAQLVSIDRTNSPIALTTGNIVNTGDTLNFSGGFPLQIQGGKISGGALTAVQGYEPVLPAGVTFTLDGASLQTTLTALPTSTLVLSGSWDNNSVIVADSATITLGGAFTPEKLGTLQRTSGVVRIAGALDNTASTFTIDNIGGWQLAGGTVSGGTIAAPAGVNLAVTGTTPSTLNTVTLAANVVVQSAATLNAQNGLTLDGKTITLSNGPASAGISVTGTQTLAGNGAILFSGSSSSGFIRPVGASATMTIAPGIAIQTDTRSGTVGAAFLSTINHGLISSRTAGHSITFAGNITNHGTVEVRNGGSIVLPSNPPATFTNYSAGTLTGGTWAIYAGSTFNMGSAAITTNAADVTLSGAGSQFPALAPIANNLGRLAILAGRDFTTAGGLANSGQLIVGAASDLNVSGNLTSSGDAVLGIELLDNDSADGFGQFNISGTSTLAGALQVFFADSHAIEPGDSFLILSASSRSGTFDELVLPPGVLADVIYSATSVSLQINAVPEPVGLPAALAAAVALTVARFRRREPLRTSRGLHDSFFRSTPMCQVIR